MSPRKVEFLSSVLLVAVVDDDRSIREAICDLLQVEGIAAQSFASAEELLATDTSRFDCIITDLRMPGISGLSLQTRLGCHGQGPPLIFVTSVDDPIAREQALSAGACAWLSKPLSASALFSALSRAVNPPRRADL